MTPAHKVFRHDDQEVHAISYFLSEADEMQYICHIMRTLENDVIHVHCKRSFLVAMVAREFDIIKDEVLLTVSCPIFPSILIAKNLLTGSLKNRSIDNLETQKKYISMKNSQFFDYLLYAKSK